MLDELQTRLVPWEPIEVSHARNRPLAERPPLPKPGEQVWYRRFDWGIDPRTGDTIPPELAVVLEVQDPADTSDQHYMPDIGWVRDPNLWHLVRDAYGHPVRDGDALRYAPVADPWPRLMLRRPNGRTAQTRESRLRGSAGWLPLDYQRRPGRSRLPGDLLAAVRPALPPVNPPRKLRPVDWSADRSGVA